MTYPTDLLFDIETLINVAQPTRILVLGDIDPAFLDGYIEQKSLLKQNCSVSHIVSADIQTIWQCQEKFDVAIAINLFEHLEKTIGMQVLSRLRDVLTPQYCIALPLAQEPGESGWQLTDLFSFALSKVASYTQENKADIGLFKYNINDYKKTPDWLNSDNWANPEMWGKYWW